MEPEKYVATTRRAWGKSNSQTQALGNMAVQYRDDEFDTTETVKLYCVRGLQRVGFDRVLADEVVNEQTLEVSGEKLQELSDLVGRADILADETLAEAEEITDN